MESSVDPGRKNTESPHLNRHDEVISRIGLGKLLGDHRPIHNNQASSRLDGRQDLLQLAEIDGLDQVVIESFLLRTPVV